MVTLLLCRPCQLLRRDFVPGSYMVLDITTLVHRQNAEHMRAMFGRDDMDPPRQEPQRQEQQSMGSSSRGSSSQYTHPNLGWQSSLS